MADFGLNIAHRITENVARTWNPALPRDLRVLVPVHVDALVVREAGGDWADCRLRDPSPDAPEADSAQRLPPPFANLDGGRAPGVYLHWALPDALARVGGATTPEVPSAPDRWLVLRLAPSADDPSRRQVRGWVLRGGGAGFAPTPLEAWVEPGADGGRLTALGSGDPAWAAYYDNAANRLAFYDDLDGVPRGPVGYVVCGWYADPAADPLHPASTRRELAAILDRLAWSVAGYDLGKADEKSRDRHDAVAGQALPIRETVLSETLRTVMEERPDYLEAGRLERLRDPIPNQCLFHGSAVDLAWPRPDDGEREVGGPPPAADIRVVFGTSGPDAFGALVAAETGIPEQARLVAALALGGLHELEEPDGRARVDDRLHAAGFAALDLDPPTTERIWQSPAQGYQVPKAPTVSKPPRPGVRVGPTGVKTAEIKAKFAVTPTPKVVAGDRFQMKPPVAARPAPEAGRYVDVQRAAPRFFTPADPVLLVQGGERAFKHNGDHRLDGEGKLRCRVTGTTVDEIATYLEDGARYGVRGEDLLVGNVASGAVPPECQEMLEELAVLDPGSALPIAVRARLSARAENPRAFPMNRIAALDARVAPGIARARVDAQAAIATVRAEQTAWWATWHPAVDPGPLLAHSGLRGTLPSPIAVRPPHRPWVPLHADWELEYLPSPGRARDWTSGEVDFEPANRDAGKPRTIAGRALLSGGLATSVALTLQRVTEQAARAGGTEPAPVRTPTSFPSEAARRALRFLAESAGERVDEQALGDLSEALASMDVLAGALEHFHHKLRGEAPLPPAAAVAPPEGFTGLRAGFVRLNRLRLVDAFGQYVDLVTPDALLSPVVFSESMALPDEARVAACPPRLTGAARMHFRFLQAGGRADADAGSGPVCGWLLPDHLDRACEVFDAAGEALGQARRDLEAGVLWENAPGRPSTVGGRPRDAIPHPDVAAMMQAIVDRGPGDLAADRETALDALLRVIDSTLWSVDPFGHIGEEHLALLIGHPIAVVRAELRLELREPVQDATLDVTRIPVRLGSLSHWQDGLMGYFVDGDWHSLRPTHAAAARLARPAPAQGFLGPVGDVPAYAADFAADVDAPASSVANPYVHEDGLLWVVPNVTHRLTLLLEPHCVVHATAGLLPRKEIGLRREWIAPPLRKIAPTFRFGPVLRDPQQIRMPVAADLGGGWTWTHRADVDQWLEEDVVHATHEALLPPDPAVAQEGWLKMKPEAPPEEEGNG